MKKQLTPNVTIEQTDANDIHCFRIEVAAQDGNVYTLMFHARELVDIVLGIQVELLDWIGTQALEWLEENYPASADEVRRNI